MWFMWPVWEPSLVNKIFLFGLCLSGRRSASYSEAGFNVAHYLLVFLLQCFLFFIILCSLIALCDWEFIHSYVISLGFWVFIVSGDMGFVYCVLVLVDRMTAVWTGPKNETIFGRGNSASAFIWLKQQRRSHSNNAELQHDQSSSFSVYQK